MEKKLFYELPEVKMYEIKAEGFFCQTGGGDGDGNLEPVEPGDEHEW